MRLNRVLRFALVCLLAGAFLGLIFGLAFGESKGSGTLAVAVDNTESPQDTPTTVAADSSASQVMTPERARLIGANEMGLVLVIVYNKISADATDSSTRTPQQLHDDLAYLDSQGFYPVNISDLQTGDIDIPAGKSPVALTFDGSSPGQYRILDDGTLDPTSAVGVMQQLISGGYWHPKATFFCLLDVVPSENELFGQTERQKEKLRNLVDWGYEVGSNTMTDLDLSGATETSIASELARSQVALGDLVGSAYAVTSLALPDGKFPRALALLASGVWQETADSQVPYKYTAVVSLDKTPCPSPFSTNFNAMNIPRIAIAGENLAIAIDELRRTEGLLYISDGDPTTVSAPYTLDSSLGLPRENLGRPVIRY
jgi:peptidoglycan/xylan/chitin deacetylase (PgdA/CDA1 family)